MDEILDHMVKGKWKKDIKQTRKLELWKLAKESQGDVDVSHKIGGLLIYNQLIDECLKDIIEYSILMDINYLMENCSRQSQSNIDELAELIVSSFE